MKKSIKIILSLVLIFTLSTSLSASSLIRDITGKENKGITVKYNNQVQNLKDGNGSPVYPVIINGSTYLPVRAIADMLGADITWDGETKTISITGNGTKKDVDSAIPTDLPSTDSSSISNPNRNKTKQSQKNTSSTNQHRATSNLGTFEDPIDIGTVCSYNRDSGYLNNIAYADYRVTITNVDSITRDDIQDLGLERPEENGIIDYVMVTMKVDVTNATYQGDDDYFFLNMYNPYIYEIKTTEGNSMIGSDVYYGFKGCLDDAIDKATRSSDDIMIKVHPNESKNYSAEGNVIVGVYKNSKNLLSIKNGENYDDLAYFKLY